MNAEELYEARTKRVRDIIALEVPDRIPVTATFDFFSARYCGYTQEQLMYEPDTLWDAHLRTTVDFAPDIARNPFPGDVARASARCPRLQADAVARPTTRRRICLSSSSRANTCPPNEYDHFLSEPTDFMIRKYWPRIAGSLKRAREGRSL